LLRVDCAPTLAQLGSTQRRIIHGFGAPSARRYMTGRSKTPVERMATCGLLILTRKGNGIWIELTPHAKRLWAQMRGENRFA